MSNLGQPHSSCVSAADAFRELRWMGLLALGVHIQAAGGQLQVVPDSKPEQFFAGDTRSLNVRVHNLGAQPLSTELRLRLWQAGSTTAAPVQESPWKQIQVLPGQTILETAEVDFPAVKAETRFLVQWLEGTNRVIGTTEVLVYPTNLLAELQLMSGDEPLGVFDPSNQLKPLLKLAGVEITDLEDAGVESYRGKLAVFGPFDSKARMCEYLAGQIETLARKGVAVVWIQPPPERHDKLQPSFCTVTVGKGAVVIVQAELVADLAERPQSQLNLLHCARLALHPAPPRLPDLILKP